MRNDNNKGVNMNQPEMIVQVVRSGNRLNAFDSNGVKMTSDITLRARKKAEAATGYLGKFLMKSGNYRWKVISADDVNTTTADTTDTTSVDTSSDVTGTDAVNVPEDVTPQG